MSISLSGSPYNFNPAYNPNVFYFDSDNNGEDGFRYLVNVYIAGSSTLLGQFRVVPRIGDALGLFDATGLITNLVSTDFNPSNQSSEDAVNSNVSYDIRLGEEYNTTWLYNDYEYAGAGGGIYSGNTQLHQTGSTVAHTYLVGDQINITSSNNVNGLHTVVAVPSDYKVVIELDYFDVTPTGTIGGSVIYADNRKTKYSDLYNASGYTVFNGALPFIGFPNYNGTVYSLSSTSPTTSSALTNLPVGGTSSNSMTATLTQDMWVNYFNSESETEDQSIRFTNSNGDILTSTIWTGSGQGKIRQVAIGPNNASPTTVESGSTPLIKSDTEWYEFETFYPTSGSATSKTYRVYVDRRCQIEQYEMVFMDRMGSMLSYAFPLRSKDMGSIKRDSYKQQIGDLSNGQYDYNSYDKGTTNSNIQVTKTLTINTDWMGDNMSVLFEELLSSPVTYIKVNDDYVACTVKDSSFEVKRQKNKNLIRQTITVTMANQNIINY